MSVSIRPGKKKDLVWVPPAHYFGQKWGCGLRFFIFIYFLNYGLSDGFFEQFFSISPKSQKIARKIIKKKMKWGLETINNWPFETGISRICRFMSPLQIREIPGSNGQLFIIFRPHFFFIDFSGDFFEISEKSKKNRPKNPSRVIFRTIFFDFSEISKNRPKNQ